MGLHRNGLCMRLRSSLPLLALLAAAPPAAAQVPAAPQGWHLGAGVDVLQFGDVGVSDPVAADGPELRPSGRLAVHVRLVRAFAPWHGALEADWAGGSIDAHNDIVVITDRSSGVSRYRIALALGRRLAGIGSGALLAELVPTVDLWSLLGEHRIRAGAEGRLVLLVPLAGVQLEHRLGLGISGSPLEPSDIGPAARTRPLRTMSAGLGLRLGL